MLSYLNIIESVIFILAILLFFRGIVLFLLLFLFNKTDKKKVINGIVTGFAAMLISFTAVQIFEEYGSEYVNNILMDIIENKEGTEVYVSGSKCKKPPLSFIKELSEMKEQEEYNQVSDEMINIKIVKEGGKSISLGARKKNSTENEYLIFFNELIATKNQHIGIVETTYISECLAEKTGKEKERTETGSETK